MPHCQKEKHDHCAKSKKERQLKKQQALARKQSIIEKKTEEELEAKKRESNNIALADGFGEYNVGCEPERELKARFNVNKRSKKHLRLDTRRNQERKEREEEERLKKEKEEEYRMQQEKSKEDEIEEEEEEVITEEYLVYICLCCQKRFKTSNQFVNHTNSKQHRENASLYEEAGVIVTNIERRSDDNEEDDYLYEEDLVNEYKEQDGTDYDENSNCYETEEEEDEEEEDEEEEGPKRVNVFAAFADDDDSSSSSSSDSSEEEDDDKNEGKREVLSESAAKDNEISSNIDDDNDDIDLLEEIIYQNRLNNLLIPDCDNEEGGNSSSELPAPVSFDDELYNPDYYTANENRLLSVQNRLQKRLAARGIEPSQINGIPRTTDAVSIGKTLLQQVMEASLDTLQSKLDLYNKHKAGNQLLGREFKFAKGNSKALPSQYTFRIDPADNARRRANVHHTGSHYHMQAARSMQFGREKGLMARHSAQGSRLQASRMAAKEMARKQAGGVKVGKTSKKSVQKRRGEAGGSKKSGGVSTSEN